MRFPIACRILAAASVLVICLSGQAAARAPAGWKTTKIHNGQGCLLNGPSFKSADLSVAAEGPQLLLLISADEFPEPESKSKISIKVDSNPAFETEVSMGGHVFGLPLLKKLADILDQGNQVTVQTEYGRFEFSLKNIGKAMDAALNCAGQPTRAEIYSNAPKPIEPGSSWSVHVPTGATDCTLRRNGDEIDVMVFHNQAGKLVLASGKPSWLNRPETIKAKLQIDDDPPIALKTGIFTNVVLAVVEDDALVARLLHAESILWFLPFGNYRAKIDGLNHALTALTECERQHPQGKPR